MFKNLADFSYKRTGLQALGFYLAYLLLTVIAAMVSAVILGVASGNSANVVFGYRVGVTVAILISMGMAFLVIKNRKLQKNFLYILLALVSGILAFFGGGLLGLIPAAFLTTRNK